MNTFNILIKFKDLRDLEIQIQSKEDLKARTALDFNDKANILWLGDYLFAKDQIKWIRIEGENLSAKHSGK